MKEIKFDSTLRVYDSMDELSPEDQSLVQKAVEQLPKAYAPYSNFHVASAVILEDGQIFTGVNQENASFPLCICGERVALYNAGANAHDVAPKTIAIIAKNQIKDTLEPCTPCGACRQVICEFEIKHGKNIKILLKGGDGDKIYEIASGKDLLPFFFDPSCL